MTDSKLLARLGSVNDAEDTLETLKKHKVDFVIKRNLRKESQEDWLTEAQAYGEWRHPREGKTVYVGDTRRQCGKRSWRVVFEVIERTIDRDGQKLMFPEIEISTYWTSLGPRQATPDEVIKIYHSHGTSEQFHSELKTDLDLERLPSGRFAVNSLVLTCGMVAYNILRLTQALHGRRRKKTSHMKHRDSYMVEMRFCERIWIVIATCKKQGKSVFEFPKAAVAATFTGTPYPQLIA